MSTTIQPLRHARKPRGQGASRRGEILAAATRIFLEEGIAHATMRRIAAAVGVSTTAIYVYFSDKEAILQAIAEATFAELLEALEKSQNSGASELDRLRVGLRAYVEFGLARPDAYRLTFLSSPASRAGVPCVSIQAADHSFEILQRGVETLMAAGVFRQGSPESTAEAVWACLHGVTALLLDQAEHVSTPPSQLIDQVINMVVAGLTT